MRQYISHPACQHVRRPHFSLLALLTVVLVLAGCGTVPKPPASPADQVTTPQKNPTPAVKENRTAHGLPPAGSGRGGYYLDDGPGDQTPEGLQSVPDAEPKIEPYATRGNRPYVVFGKNYTPMINNQPFRQRGLGSWYGKKFHGQKTSSGELYDMYKMTAAHPTLPIPSYARVTNVGNGAQVIVRINDRGPFHSSRVIDLSYTAALKLGYISKGSTELEVERLLPDEIQRMASSRGSAPQPAVAAVAAAVAMPAAQMMTIENLMGTASMPLAVTTNTSMTDAQPITSTAIANVSNVASTVNPRTTASYGHVYLQLGSFSQSDNADQARTRLLQKWNTAHPPIDIARSGTLYRLYTGPFANRTEAAAAALQIEDAGLGLARPFIVQR